MHSCIPRRASQFDSPLLSFLLLFGLGLGDYVSFVSLSHLQDHLMFITKHLSVVLCVCTGFWSEEVILFWHLVSEKKTAFPLCWITQQKQVASSMPSEIHVEVSVSHLPGTF